MERNDQAGSEIQSLRAEVERLRAENRQLRQRLGLSDQAVSMIATTSHLTQDQKLALFRQRFHGRQDVYAVRWVSKKTEKSGYSPARARRHLGSDSRDPELLPLTDQVLIAHLTGKMTLGVYPLLQDETCHFVAVDFDKASWREDCAAFAKTGLDIGIHIALERSRSGNGAHAWIFFGGSVEARLARQLATALLTRTMETRPQLSLASYDRLFPSQDTLPKGGFGNLIALPLQGQSRREGNTVFLDGQLEPISDQWKFLQDVDLTTPSRAQETVTQILDSGPLINVRQVDPNENVLAAQESLRLPYRSAQPSVDLTGLRVRVVLESRAQLAKSELPPAALSQVIRLASFQNPEFSRFQAMRLSTFGKPRIICCADDLGESISIPRGCLPELLAWLQESKATVDLVDATNSGIPMPCDFKGRLAPRQAQALEALLRDDIGMLVAPPAFGKTVVAAAVIAARRRNTLVLVHRRQLMDQWKARLQVFLPAITEIGEIGGGKNKPTGLLDVAMLQTLNRKGQVKKLVEDYGQIIVDECHHISAFRFEEVLNRVRAKNVLGLTATPTRRDGHHPIIQMQCGPIRFRVDPRSKSRGQPSQQEVIPRITDFQMEDQDPPIQQVMAALASDQGRNDMIFDDVVSAVDCGRNPILLTQRISQLEHFEARLRRFCKNVLVFKGGQSDSVRAELLKKLESVPGDEERLVLATGSCIGEGFDDPRLDTLFLSMPISWKGLLQQYLGRLQRHSPGKSEVLVYDYVDQRVRVLERMFQKRCRGYRSLGFVVRSLEKS